MSHILPGLKGHDWEAALLITRPRGRGVPRVVDEPENLALIFNYRRHEIHEFKDIDKIKDFLRSEYNLNASSRSIREALKIITQERNEAIIGRVITQYAEAPFPHEVRILDLLKDELAWIDSTSKLWIVAESLDRLGYKRWTDKKGFAIWIKKNPPVKEGSA